jgi:PAN domain
MRKRRKNMKDSTQSTVVRAPRAIYLTRLFIFAVFILGSIVLMIFSWSAFAREGVNMPGRDYDHFDAPSAVVCRNTCGGESRCQAYTWVKPGLQGPSGVCWLKDSAPKMVNDACCNSDLHPSGVQRTEDRIDRPGSDFENFNTSGWEECETACTQNKSCASWTYVRPGVQGPSGRCWLKNRVARPVANSNMISGVKFRPASVRID